MERLGDCWQKSGVSQGSTWGVGSDRSDPQTDVNRALRGLMSDLSPTFMEFSPDRSGLEPELGGFLRDAPDRSGLEPELGGALRQNGVYVDEITCIGCKHCAHVAPNTFYIEDDYGRSRVFQQDGDSEELIQEAIDTCPVNCIHWVDYTELKQLEEERKHQTIPLPGTPPDWSAVKNPNQQSKNS